MDSFGERVSTHRKAKLVCVLQEAMVNLCRPENDFVWSKWDNAATATTEVASHIDAIERDDLSRLSDLALLFAPTGAIQEVAVSSGWGTEFLALATKFDEVASKVRL
jgi:hypothetical protein